MIVIWEFFCLLLSLQTGQKLIYHILMYHYTGVSTACMYKDVHCGNATDLFTTESRQPDMVANKIKSTTTPVGFHGHIRHQSLMSGVSGAIFVRRTPLITPSHSNSKTGLYINTSLGGHLLDMRSSLPEVKKKIFKQ